MICRHHGLAVRKCMKQKAFSLNPFPHYAMMPRSSAGSRGKGVTQKSGVAHQQDKGKLVLQSWCKLTGLQVLARGVTSQGLMAFLGSHHPFLVLGMFAPCRSSQQLLAILEQLLLLKALLD